jgi:hypothetical protein
VQGASTIHPRGRLNALLALAAIVVIAAAVALMEASWVTLYDAEGNPHRIHLRTGWAGDAAPWVVLYDAEGNAHLVSAP